MRTRIVSLRAIVALCVLTAHVGAGETSPSEVLEFVLPTKIAPMEAPKPLPVDPQNEIDAGALWPAEGDALDLGPGLGRIAFTRAKSSDALGRENVRYLAFYAEVNRFAEVEIETKGTGSRQVFVDGQKFSGKGNWRRGLHRVVVRAEGKLESLALKWGKEGVRLETTLDSKHGLADYSETKFFGSLGAPVLSEDGRFLACSVKDAHPSGDGVRRIEIIDTNSGLKVASGIGGPTAQPLAMNADGSALLIRSGDDLALYDRGQQTWRTLLKGEAGLGSVAWAKNGSFLVFASTKGTKEKSADGPQRRVELREKLSDWPTRPHLHLLAIDSLARRRLTLPGDATWDSFAITPDDKSLIVMRSLPIAKRPWFETEVWQLDLATGASHLVTKLGMGFENRPGLSEIKISPDGRMLAFLAPPVELGDDRLKPEEEPNVFDPDLYVLDLGSGKFRNVSQASEISPEAHLEWSADSRSIYFLGSQKGMQRMYAAATAADASVSIAPHGARPFEGAVSAATIAPSGAFAVVSSAPDRLATLDVWRTEFGTGMLRAADPNAALSARLDLVTPIREDVILEPGLTIQTWLYRPHGRFVKPDAKLPLVVYFYGGATATLYGFSDLHQYFTGNGYAVLVVNPRGCGGFGDDYSRSHVGDWGNRAASDIERALDAVLRKHPEIDGSKVGCYGGSYGGFMTMALITRSPRFAAAVSMYGISNLASYFGEGTWGFTYGDQAMARLYPWNAKDFYVEHSPVFAADKVHTPLLLLHGTGDTNVPVGESEQMFTALKLLGREVELVRFPGEDHGLRGTTDNRIAHREMLLDWFDRYLKGEPDTWSARW